MLALLLSMAAGSLTTLSPCVLPLVPLVIGSSRSESRSGPLALALGLTTSFTVLGLIIASLSRSFDFDPSWSRIGGAILMGCAGLVLLAPRLQEQMARALQPLADRAQRFTAHLPSGLFGQFLLGAVLGMVWSPCAGPTLGAAIALTSRSGSTFYSTLQMALFGLGAAVPLIGIGYLSRHFLVKSRSALIQSGTFGKALLGLTLVSISLAIVTGVDKRIEAAVLDHLPSFWVNITTAL